MLTSNDKTELGELGIRDQPVGLELGESLDSQTDVLLCFKSVQRDEGLLVADRVSRRTWAFVDSRTQHLDILKLLNMLYTLFVHVQFDARIHHFGFFFE